MSKKVLLAMAVPIALAAMLYWGVPMLSKNRISGRLIDAVLIPSPSGRGTLCILTDGSLSFYSKVRTARRQFQGRKGIFCKTHLYRYDPAARKVLGRQTRSYDQLPPEAVLLQVKDGLWEISVDPARHPARILVHPLSGGAPLMDTAQVMGHFGAAGELPVKQSVSPYPPYVLTLTTDKAREMVIDLAMQRTASDVKGLLVDPAQPVTRLALADPEGGSRRRLWRLAEGDWRLYQFHAPESAFSHPNFLKRNFGARVEPLSPDKIYLDGLLIYQDASGALILHQEALEPNADRRLTYTDHSGRVNWSLDQAQLFPGLALSERDPFSTAFFIQSRLRAKKSDGLFLVIFQPEGFMGIDLASGRVMWRHDF